MIYYNELKLICYLRAACIFRKSSTKDAAKEFQELCKKAQDLSNKGLVECIIIATINNSKNNEEEAEDNLSTNNEENNDIWGPPTVFSTPSLTKLVPFIKASNHLNEKIPQLATEKACIADDMARMIEYPTKTQLPEAENILESKIHLKIMRNDLEKIRNYLKKSIGWSQWQGNAIINHKIIDKNYFYYIEGVDIRFWDLMPKKDIDLITVWQNIGLTSITKKNRIMFESVSSMGNSII